MTRSALALILCAVSAPVAAQVTAAPAVIVDGTILDVSATGRTTRVPDLATIRAGVVTTAPTAAAALAANAARMNRVLAALKTAGLDARDVQTASISLQPQYRYVQNQAPALTGYQASNSVAVRFRDIARSGTILDTLVQQGANQIDGPNLSIDKPEAAMDEARVDAITKARARAELYARAAGLRVDRIVSIGEGGEYAPAPPPMPMMVRTQAVETDSKIAAGEQDVAVSVGVRFLLK